MGRPWTEKEDRFLITYGPAVGFGYVAQHDLCRSHRSGHSRIAWLRKFNPEFVKAVDAEADEAELQERDDA